MKLANALAHSKDLAITFDELAGELEGDVKDDLLHRLLYAQDASVYSRIPHAVVFPKNTTDVAAVLKFADAQRLPVVSRGAGTSLAGQTIGQAIVLDVGRYMNRIISFDEEARTVRVQPGVVLEELNRYLEPFGLWFGPDTSTANRCMIGGMIGNNSCGTHSILYGNTMQHVLSMQAVFSDGTTAELGLWDADKIQAIKERDDRLGRGVAALFDSVGNNLKTISQRYPNQDVIRRNTGYPLDDVANRTPFDPKQPASLARFLCGTEGTLAVTTEATLNLVPRPKTKAVVCVHFDDLMDALRATVVAIEHQPAAVELIDRRILEQTKINLEQSRNRSFIEGDPDAILIVEFYADSLKEIGESAIGLIDAFKSRGFGYAYPVIHPPNDKKVWDLRKAGLGLLMGIPGDKKAVSVVEDTAVPVAALPDYIARVQELMARKKVETVYHAHASVGELHIRPELNLKDATDVQKFVDIGEEVADLVREFGGSLSGEHGDGLVRSPLIERFYGNEITDLFATIKHAFDPNSILNPKNIVDPGTMTDDFRFEPGSPVPEVDAVYDWSADFGFFRAVEKCNGAGACRKKAEAGGVMCPSYMATLDERDTTRGRANVLRELLIAEPTAAMESDVVYDAMDLCMSCKGCKSECPASVDMARIKSEFTQKYHDKHGVPFSSKVFGHFADYAKFGSKFGGLARATTSWGISKWFLKTMVGVSPKRTLPAIYRHFGDTFQDVPEGSANETVWLYIDPFIGYTEPHVANAVVDVLQKLGFGIKKLPIEDDGRALLSKGFLREAKELSIKNTELVRSLDRHPIVGIEPSALLTLRDETIDLVGDELKADAVEIASRTFLFDEFLAAQISGGVLGDARERHETVLLHGHCHQKALVGNGATISALNHFGFEVEELDSGCCGMAGSFGYEESHYDVSMQVGELVLFPALRETTLRAVSPGTSCRHQIQDGVSKRGYHPAELIAERL